MVRRMIPTQMIEAFRDFYADTSRSREHTHEGLQQAQDEVSTLMVGLAADEA